MTDLDLVPIALVAGTFALGLLLLGYRIYEGARRDVSPLIKIKSFWLWLALVVLWAAAIGAGMFFVLIRANPPA